MKKSSMQIGIIAHASLGGSALIATELAIALATRGHDIHLFCQQKPFLHRNNLEQITIHQINTTTNLCCPNTAALKLEWTHIELHNFINYIFNFCKNNYLDILHFHYAIPFAHICHQIQKQLSSKAPTIIGTLHGSDVSIYGQQDKHKQYLGSILPKFDCLTTVSKNHAKLATKTFNLNSPPMVIPNFIDPSKFYPSDSYHFRKTKKILHISNCRKVKNLETIAKTFALAYKTIDSELWLVGANKTQKEIVTIFEKYKIPAERILFLGHRNNIATVISQADLMLIASQQESFCLAALEAMACGLPVVAPQVGGIPELITHNHTGLLFSPNDHFQAAQNIIDLLSNHKKYLSMRNQSILRARKFNQHKIIPLYEKLYIANKKEVPR